MRPSSSPSRKTMWVKCETPTTGRSYFIHRRTGKISWSDPAALLVEPPQPNKEKQLTTSSTANDHPSSPMQATVCIGNNNNNNNNINRSSNNKNYSIAAPGTSTGTASVMLPPAAHSHVVHTSTQPQTWTSDESRRMQRFFKRWVHRGQLKVFTQWKLFVLYDRIHDQLQEAHQKNVDLENSIKLSKAQSELALEKAHLQSWKKAEEEKNITLKRSALRRLKKWVNGRSQNLGGGFKTWVQFTNQHRLSQINELVSDVDAARSSNIEFASLRSQYEIEKKKWNTTVSRQVELIAGLQSDVEMLQECKEKLTSQTDELQELQHKYKTEKTNWLRRFQMQQELIDRLEHDVEELSELKVLELAENYYDGT